MRWVTPSAWAEQQRQGQRKLAALAYTGEDTRRARNLAAGNAEARAAEMVGLSLFPTTMEGEWFLELGAQERPRSLPYEKLPYVRLFEVEVLGGRDLWFSATLVGGTHYGLFEPRITFSKWLRAFPNTLDAFKRRLDLFKFYIDGAVEKEMQLDAVKRIGA